MYGLKKYSGSEYYQSVGEIKWAHNVTVQAFQYSRTCTCASI